MPSLISLYVFCNIQMVESEFGIHTTNTISDECFQHIVESIRGRLKIVLKAKGGATQY